MRSSSNTCTWQWNPAAFLYNVHVKPLDCVILLNRIESMLEQTRKELAAKRSLEKAKQDQLQMEVDSLEKSMEQLVSHPLKQLLCCFHNNYRGYAQGVVNTHVDECQPR